MTKEIVNNAIQTGTETWLEKAKNFIITDSESLKVAGVMALAIKKFRTKTVQKELGPPKEAAGQAHKVACALFNKYVNPLLAAEKQLTVKIYTHEQKMEQIRRIAAEKAEREAEEAARKERERLEAEALKAADAGDDEAFALAETEKEMVSSEDFVPIPAPKENMPAGISTRANWQVEVIDETAALKAAIGGQAPANFAMLNMKAINKWAKAVGKSQKIPGIRVWDAGTVSLRS